MATILLHPVSSQGQATKSGPAARFSPKEIEFLRQYVDKADPPPVLELVAAKYNCQFGRRISDQKIAWSDLPDLLERAEKQARQEEVFQQLYQGRMN